ncbi:hypothetical protein BASA62_008255 [Batrachochytrium salamandrivorans]|nr:hypothetical protein BASA62_008255 [Batrachochytrium salamandrivorans]
MHLPPPIIDHHQHDTSITKRTDAFIRTLARLEHCSPQSLVTTTPSTNWLIFLNVSYDAGITGADLEHLLLHSIEVPDSIPLSSSVNDRFRIEMFLGSKPYSFVCCESVALAQLVYLNLHGKTVAAWGGRVLLLAYAACSLDHLLPHRCIVDPAATTACPVAGLTLIHDFVSVEEEQRLLWLLQHSRSHTRQSLNPLESNQASSTQPESNQPSSTQPSSTQPSSTQLESNQPSLNPLESNQPSSTQPESSDLEWEYLHLRAALHYGSRFNYPRNSVDHTSPFSLLRPLLDQLTINHYLPGGGIAPHSDTHSSFKGPIIIVSIGSGVVMEFRQRIPKPPHAHLEIPESSSVPDATKIHYTTINIYLAPRSLLVMEKDARLGWQHAIRPRKMDLVDGKVCERGERWSLTFRTLRDAADSCTCQWPYLCN